MHESENWRRDGRLRNVGLLQVGGVLKEQEAAWRVEVEMKDSITTVGEESWSKLLDLSMPSS